MNNNTNKRPKKIKVKKYKIPIERKNGKIIEKNIELKPEHLIDEKEIDIPENKTLMFFLPEFTKKIGDYNKRQIKYAEELEKDQNFIFKKIVTR